MESNVFLGFALLLIGAVCGGSFGLPSKFVKKDTPWETLWGPFFLFVTVLLPCGVFPLIARSFFATVSAAGPSAVLAPILFGLLWGLGSMTLGLSFAFIGLSLAYAINYGAQIAFGGMGPFILHNRDQLCTTHGGVIMAGVATCIAGVIVCGRAAVLKSRGQGGADATVPKGGALIKGLLMAFLSGVLCACYSLGFSYGGAAMHVSMSQFGNEGWRASFVVSALILWGGCLSACGYCAWKFTRNHTWGTLAAPGIGRTLAVALVMALLHDGAIVFFGVGASRLGPLGVAVGYAVFMSFAIIVGNINGFLTKEWKNAGAGSVRWILAGIAVLILGVSLLATGNYLQGQYPQPAPAAPEAGK